MSKNKMTMELIEVNPKMAQQFLNSMRKNRNPRIRKVEYLTKQMIDGEFHPTHHALGFDSHGRMFDGQHRMLALIKSGKTLPFWICKNVPDKSMPYCDKNVTRTIAQSLVIDCTIANKADARIAVVNSIWTYPYSLSHGSDLPTIEETKKILSTYEEEIEYVLSMLSSNERNGIRTAPVRACVARAMKYVDKSKIDRFCQLLKDPSEQISSEESAPTKLVLYCANDPTKWATESSRKDLYCRTQRAMKAFVEKEKLGVLKPIYEDLYPLV
jgi:hypothetical protein